MSWVVVPIALRLRRFSDGVSQRTSGRASVCKSKGEQRDERIRPLSSVGTRSRCFARIPARHVDSCSRSTGCGKTRFVEAMAFRLDRRSSPSHVTRSDRRDLVGRTSCKAVTRRGRRPLTQL